MTVLESTLIDTQQSPEVEPSFAPRAAERVGERVSLESIEGIAYLGVVEHNRFEIQVGYLPNGALRVYAPFVVRFAPDHEQIVAESPAFNEFGFGGDAMEALRDLLQAISQLYVSLHKDRERLGPDLAAVWDNLQKHVRVHDAQALGV